MVGCSFNLEELFGKFSQSGSVGGCQARLFKAISLVVDGGLSHVSKSPMSDWYKSVCSRTYYGMDV